MPIEVFVPGDPRACRDCADRLEGLAAAVARQSTAFVKARWTSESEWQGSAGDGFRERISGMNVGASGIAESARTAAEHLRVFADGLETARARMGQAVEIADRAGLRVESDGSGPVVIADPDEAVGDTIDAGVRAAQQRAAYDEAAEIAGDGRDAESAAHTALQGVLGEIDTAVQDMRAQWYWMAAAGVTGYIGTAAGEVVKWAEVSDIRRGQLDKFRTLATDAARSGDPYWETTAARAVTTFESAADDAARVVSQNNRLIGGLADNPVAKALSTPVMKDGASAISKVGSKVPVVGVVLTGTQTYFDVRAAEDGGDAALAIAKNTSGFVAGTGATALILASVAGGPATVVAVGVGALVTWGTGYAIQKVWGD
ncbi:hypothetical protein [Prescottella sp. R16]|uniref:WXG100-like domain-containing protein n=1 Tax=Prescottella sp. R16 TaxID=3064529 RepID=UPI00272DFFAC|nr:hypothetical protein [Prescottella sp. R16]